MTLAEPFNVGKVTISLDTELGWGRVDSGEFSDIEERLNQGKSAFNRLISLFEDYSIPATWAITGQLFREVSAAEGWEDVNAIPIQRDKLPLEQEWWRAPSLVTALQNSPVEHEIASHSATHVPYDQLTGRQANEDLEAFQTWSENVLSTKAKSFVFPQNRIEHLDLVRDAGYRCFRGLPPFLGTDPSPTAFRPRLKRGLVNIPASVAYRQYDGRNFLLRHLPDWSKIEGMKMAVKYAAVSGRVCHVVLHPKDFTLADGENLLERFQNWLDYVQARRHEGEIEVKTTAEIAKEARFNR